MALHRRSHVSPESETAKRAAEKSPLGVGLAASVGFLILHRPGRFSQAVEINAS
ncbi:hypothetical protein [Streptomyces sp. NEAU-174]|uniref:hypothetical protein n=1 Tax=Streptomyces sp. NEAU-174 TaxID=3458254 RepID=UPI004044E4A2